MKELHQLLSTYRATVYFTSNGHITCRILIGEDSFTIYADSLQDLSGKLAHCNFKVSIADEL